MTPTSIVLGLTVACALIGLLLFASAVRVGRGGRGIAAGFRGLMAIALFALAAAVWLFGTNLTTYHRLTYERPILEMSFERIGERWFTARLHFPNEPAQALELRGDEAQVDARLLRWKVWVHVLGFDTLYRVERMSGRYRDVKSERSEQRSVHELHGPGIVDTWELARRYQERMPWIEAYYGSATYVPMADQASYEVRLSPTGLTARPINDAARKALGQWK